MGSTWATHHIDPDIRDRAAIALERCGLTVSDAVRILLTRVVNEGALPPGLVTDTAAHDAWFRAKIREALENAAPLIPHAEVEAHFTRRRAALRSGKHGGEHSGKHSAKPAT